MSSIKTTQIDGDIAVGRNMNMGGDAHVAGNTTVEHNLTVKGWLRADNVKQPNCGLFATVEALEAAFPEPKVGMWAVVGDTVPGDIYRCETEGEWTATGETGGVDSIDNVLLYSEQELSSAEKKQARANIGLGDGDIDEEPTAGSHNLVKSGGVKAVIESLDAIKEINEDKFAVADENGNVALQYDSEGLDSAKVTSHLKGLIVNDERDRALTAEEALVSSISNIENDIETLLTKNELIKEIEDDKFAITDDTGNVAMEVDENGNIDANGFGTHLTNEISKLAGGGSVADESYRKAYSELQRLKDEMSHITDSIVAVKETNGNNYSGTITIPMSQATGVIKHGVFRIGLHYGSHLGSNIWHEVFFDGNVKKDFSDVRIKDANGRILPTRLIHSGNYEVVQDYRVESVGEHLEIHDGKAYFLHQAKIYVTDNEFGSIAKIDPSETDFIATFYMDSKGGIWYSTSYLSATPYKVYVCYPVNGRYDFANAKLVCDLTTTNGIANTQNGNLKMNGFVEDADGYIYFGVYHDNYNPVIFKSTSTTTVYAATSPSSLTVSVIECFHETIVYRTGAAETPENVDGTRVDQHVHHIAIHYAKDANNNDVCNIIAGLDNDSHAIGPNLISSIDGGLTWVSFRDTIEDIDWRDNFRGKDYSFTWMSSDNSFTICGGESDIKGGYTLSKMYTFVDANGRITPTGKVGFPTAIYGATRHSISDGDNCILSSIVSTFTNYFTSIVLSTDKAKTWKTIYSDYRIAAVSAGGGIRRFTDKVKLNGSEDSDACFYGVGFITSGNVNSYPPVKVYTGGEHYYGELLVDVGSLEAGTDVVLTVESGYMASAPNKMVLDSKEVSPVWELPLNEGAGDTVIDSMGVSHKINGSYKWGSLLNSPSYYYSLPTIGDYEKSGGLCLNSGATIELGKIDVLKFKKDFSVIVWLAHKDKHNQNRSASFDDLYNNYFPILGSDSFALGQVKGGFYIGQKQNNNYSSANVTIAKIKGIFKPFLITVSDNNIPVVTAYSCDAEGVVLNTTSASSWISVNLCELNLTIGSPNLAANANGEINKPMYIGGIAIYNKVLSQNEFRSIVYGRTINEDFNKLNH